MHWTQGIENLWKKMGGHFYFTLSFQDRVASEVLLHFQEWATSGALRQHQSPFTEEKGQGINLVSPHNLQIPNVYFCMEQCRRPCKAWYPHNIRVVCSILLKTRAQSGSLSFWLVVGCLQLLMYQDVLGLFWVFFFWWSLELPVWVFHVTSWTAVQ